MNALGATDYYALLEVPQRATTAEIAASYKRLARIKHPDKNRDNPDATTHFQELQAAYTVLRDAASRRDYDTKFRALSVQQEQIRLFHQHRKKTAFTGINTCDIKSWHQTSGLYTAVPTKDPWMTAHVASTKYPPSPPDKSVWPERPPPTDKKLENDIRAARKDVIQKEKQLASLAKELKEKQNMATVLWQLADNVKTMKANAEHRQAQIKADHQEKAWHAALRQGQTAWNFPQLQSTAIVRPDGTTAVQDVPAIPYAPPATPLAMDADAAESLQGLEAALDRLATKAAQIATDMDNTTLDMRRIASESQAIEREKTKSEATLRELSRRWRIHHFGAGASRAAGAGGTQKREAGDSDGEDNNETAFDMWAAWGDDECGSDGAPEWPDHDVDPDWDPHQPYYDDWSAAAHDDGRDERPVWDSVHADAKEDEAEEALLVDLVDDDDDAVPTGGDETVDVPDRQEAATTSVAYLAVLEHRPESTKESVWHAYKVMSATSIARPTTADASRPGSPAPQDTGATTATYTPPKPTERQMANVWAAKDGDLIDLGLGCDETARAPSNGIDREVELGTRGPAIGELPRRWYANGQAAHDALRHDGWTSDSWQRDNCHEW